MDLEGKFLQIIQVVINCYCSPPGVGAFSRGL